MAPEENLFWSGTELDAAYVPLNVRRQPFYVGDNPDEWRRPVRRSGESVPRRVRYEGTLVNPDGSDSAYLKSVLAMLGELVAGRAPTEQFVATLLSLDLLAPLLLDIVLDDGTPLKVQGLYGLDEDRFRQLPAAQLCRSVAAAGAST